MTRTITRKSAEEAERRAIELEGQAKDYMQKAEELEAQEEKQADRTALKAKAHSLRVRAKALEEEIAALSDTRKT